MKTPFIPLPLLLLTAVPGLADTSLEFEEATLSGQTDVVFDSDASGGAYVACLQEAQLEGSLTTNGLGALALGGRSFEGGSVVVTLLSTDGETWSDVVTFPDSGAWAELVTPDIPMLTTTGETVTVTVTTTSTVDMDYTSTETCTEVFTCTASSRNYAVSNNSATPDKPGLYTQGNCYFLTLPSGGWAAMGSDFDPSTGKSVVSALSSAGAGLARGPVYSAVAGAAAYTAQSLQNLYGQLLSFTARYTAGKCSVDGCKDEPCKFDAELQFKMLGANGFGSTMQLRITRGASNPTTSYENLAAGAAGGGDTTTKISINLSAACGYVNEAYIEWGGTSWYQPAWDWFEFYLRCADPCAYQDY